MSLQSEYGFSEGSGTTTADTSGNSHTLSGSGFVVSAKNGSGAGGATMSWAASTNGIGSGTGNLQTTICAWFNAHNLPGSGIFVGILTTVTGNKYLEYSASGSAVLFDFYGGTGIGLNATSTTPLDTPTFVAVVTNGTAATIYMGTTSANLAQAGTGDPIVPNGAGLDFTLTDWKVGSSADESWIGTGDWIDEIRVFNTALTLSELQTWMDTGVGTSSTSTMPIMWFYQ